VFGSGIRRLDGEALGSRRLARTPPRRVTRWLAASTIGEGLEKTAPSRPRGLRIGAEATVELRLRTLQRCMHDVAT